MSTLRAGTTQLIWDDSAFRRQIASGLAQLPEVVARRLVGTRDAVLDVARADWPVDTGESRSALDPVDDWSPLRIGIRSDVPYVPYIAGDPWNTLVVFPFERRMAAVVDELTGDIEALFAGLGGRR